MKIIAEVILSDDTVATIRQILAIDWLTLKDLTGPAADVAMIAALTRFNGKTLTSEEVLELPIEDYILLNHTIANEVKRVMNYVPIFKES